MIDNLLKQNLLPDSLIRFGIKRLLKQRLNSEHSGSVEEEKTKFMELINTLKKSPIAVNTADANEQHYEVPTQFYQYALGKNLKYSCGYWDKSTKTLDEAEDKMLELTCKRANIKDGESVLELGCGWGSLTLYMAKNFPNAKITALSNSATQREHILDEAKKLKLENVEIITADINDFSTDRKFDRVVSVEMFEHMRNYETLFNNISNWLKDNGELFVHIFSHKKYAYLFEVKDETDWMSKYFFTGGIMPSDNLLLYFAKKFEVANHWIVNGTHYQKTSEAWLSNMDKNKKSIVPLFEETYGKQNVNMWWAYWRIFFMSCAELWGFKNGKEWFVSHYLFRKV
ncbi:MAG: class I SAM-dependent methyltransferase [Melioribacteraceae bacterium]|nr:class I SAM-dependent methyltransferase [Melioribacteraceae bacterium]